MTLCGNLSYDRLRVDDFAT